LLADEQLTVVAQSDPGRLLTDDLMLKAEDDAGDERVGDEPDEHQHERQDEEPGDLPVTAERALECGPARHGVDGSRPLPDAGNGGHRHAPSSPAPLPRIPPKRVARAGKTLRPAEPAIRERPL
jgi:hypothetical protein